MKYKTTCMYYIVILGGGDMRLYAKEKLSEAIVLNGYSITKFAEEIGVTRGYLYTVLSRKNSLSPSLAIKISETLGRDIQELFFTMKSKVEN